VPPFKPEIQKGEEDKYFSHVKDKFNMQDTYIPRTVVEKIETYQDKFENFDKNNGKGV